MFLFYFAVSEKTKFDKDSLGRLSKNHAKHLIWIVIYCLANIYVDYFEKWIQGSVLKYLSIYFIVWVWEHKYNMYANIIKLIWVETPSNRSSLFQCSARLTRLSAVSNENSDFFSDQIRHFESQFGNMDDLLLTFAYNVKTTHFQPSSNKVLQPKKRWDVLCRIIREC